MVYSRQTMARLTPIHLVPALIAAASHAGEITIEQQAFFIEKTFTAAVLPVGEFQLISLTPEVWEHFTLLELPAHGTKVSKGDTLVRCDAEAIHQVLADTRLDLSSQVLSLAQAEADFKTIKETAPHRLEAARRTASIAQEENSYFATTRRKSAEAIASQNLKRTEQILANQREELKQLTKMYEADDVTEDNEEIILIRQQEAVAAAEFALSMEVLEHKRTLEVLLPREGQILADAVRESALAALQAEEEIPRSIERKQAALVTLKTTLARQQKSLTAHAQDLTLFEIKAPADGTFFHGAIENGRWTPGDLVRELTLHEAAPLHRAFATFVPATAKLSLGAQLDEATARALKTELTGFALLAGREDLEIPVTLTQLATTPGPDLTYQAELTATWPKDLMPAIGSTVEIRLISYQKPLAIAVPTKVLTSGTAGWTVEVKLADGKTEHRPVKRGLSSKDETEILSGLDVGQVIVVP